jgi:16S rRNA (adenine1518-N6/adenine1519-N6)-dimethyltransferase
MSARNQVNVARRSARPVGKAKLGQNFLVDVNAARRIVDALGDVSNATAIEIGPGRGALTSMLTERAARLIAVELDRALAQELRAKFAEKDNIEIVEANFLDISLPELLRKQPPSAPGATAVRAKVIGNIPYYITSDILLRLFEQHESVETIVIMVQKEVADRLIAAPGTRDYGLLTVTAQLFANLEGLFTLPPSAFSPPPQVHSSVLRLRIRPKSGILGVDERAFLQFCKRAFAQKRKTLFNNLRGEYPPEEIRRALESLAVVADVRAEALPIGQLAAIHRSLQTRTT